MKKFTLAAFILILIFLLTGFSKRFNIVYTHFVLDNFENSRVGKFPALWIPYKRRGYKIMRVLKNGRNKFFRIDTKDEGIYVGKRLYSNKLNKIFFKESDGLEEGFSLKRNPILSWRWRVHKLPKGGDERVRSTNDSGAAVALAFKKGLIPYSLKYVWSVSLPVGTIIPSPAWFGSYTRVIVIRTGKRGLGKWINEKRNIYEDYKKAFGEYPDRFSKGIALLTDSEDTDSTSVADYDDLVLYQVK